MFHSLLAIVPLFTACTNSNADFDKATNPHKNEGEELSIWEQDQIPAHQVMNRLVKDYTKHNGQIDFTEMHKLLAFTKQYQGQSESGLDYLETLLENVGMTPEAKEILQRGEGLSADVSIELRNDVYELRLGTQDFLFDDELYLRFNGELHGDTALLSHSRGYAAKKDGVLFKRHGSHVPYYSSTEGVLSQSEKQEIGPDEALDIAASIYGLELDQWNTFSSIAHNPNYYDPSDSTPFWAGICQGWTHNALDDRINVLVDVPGPTGERGLWIFGQWISRADLGNAMMGVSYSLGIADSITIDSFVTPESMVKAMAQHVFTGGAGLRVDIWNDEHNKSGSYDPQVWNQPIVGGSIEVFDVETQVKHDILSFARNQTTGWGMAQDFVSVRRVQLNGTWGVETSDSWEEEARFENSEWNMYLLTNFEGKVVEGFMAYELVEAGIEGLPVETSDGLPDYIAVPKHELTDAAFYKLEHRLLTEGNPEGQRFRFLTGVVLPYGIPEYTRREFESAFVSGAQKEDLIQDFPGIANAYSPEEWDVVFASTLGSAERFGAIW